MIEHKTLHSGRVYLPLEAFYHFHIFRPLVLRLLPRDSHAWMNIDSPKQGTNFDYVFEAAIKRTKIEFEKTTKDVSEEMRRLFLGK